MTPSDSRARTLPCWGEASSTNLELGPLCLNRGAVAKHLGDAVHDFIGVVTHGDHGVGAGPLGMRNHQIIGLLAGVLGKVSIDGQVAAKDRLDRPAKIS